MLQVKLYPGSLSDLRLLSETAAVDSQPMFPKSDSLLELA